MLTVGLKSHSEGSGKSDWLKGVGGVMAALSLFSTVSFEGENEKAFLKNKQMNLEISLQMILGGWGIFT